MVKCMQASNGGLLALIVALTVLLAGCAGNKGFSYGEGHRMDDKPKADAQTVLTLWTMPYFPVQEDADAFFMKRAEEFKVLEPSVTLDIQTIPWASAHEKILASFAAGKGPHVLYVFPEWLYELANLKYLKPLNNRMNASDQEDFIGLEDLSYKGSIYAVPCLYGSSQYIYNLDLVSQIGWDPAGLPTNMDELEKMLAQAKERLPSGKYGIFFPGNTYEVLNGSLELIWSAGRQVINEEGVVDIGSPECIDIFDRIGKWCEYGFTPRKSVLTSEDQLPLFMKGDVLVTFLSTSMIATPSIQQLPFRWGIGPPIKYRADDEAYSFISPGGWSLTRVNSNDAIAMRFIQRLTERDSLEDFNRLSGFLPPRESCRNIFEGVKGFDSIMENIRNSKGRSGFKHPAGALASDVIRQERQAVMLGKQTASQACENIARKLEKIKKEN